MNLDDLIDYVMTESGEFIVGDLETTQIDRHRFHLIVKRALALYGRYRPLTERLTVLINERADLSNGGVTRAPEWVSRVTPLGTGVDNAGGGRQSAASFIYGNAFGGEAFGGMVDSVFGRSQMRSIPWEYNSPYLSVLGPDDMYDVTAHYSLDLVDLRKDPDTGKVLDARAEGISYKDDLFFDILLGLFLISLGRSRRAFTLNDLPVTMDGDQLVSEGQEKLTTAREQLQEQSSWHLSIGE